MRRWWMTAVLVLGMAGWLWAQQAGENAPQKAEREYKVLTFDGVLYQGHQLEPQLNALAREGWEIVGLTAGERQGTPGSTAAVIVLQRTQ